MVWAATPPLELRSVRILLLEDEPADAALIQRELTKAGLVFVSQRVDTRAGFEEALRVFSPDLILSDHGLPGFDGAAALQFVKERFPALPVILVTGSLNEETAILHRGVLQQGVAFLQKPLSLRMLARKVREVIEARP